MRELTAHKVNPANDTLKVLVVDEPGHGGANHCYDITGGQAVPCFIRFQNGPIAADGNGVNGITHEALLAILIDRLTAFQAGPYACFDNEQALGALADALESLRNRTKKRMRAGIEGTHKV